MKNKIPITDNHILVFQLPWKSELADRYNDVFQDAVKQATKAVEVAANGLIKVSATLSVESVNKLRVINLFFRNNKLNPSSTISPKIIYAELEKNQVNKISLNLLEILHLLKPKCDQIVMDLKMFSEPFVTRIVDTNEVIFNEHSGPGGDDFMERADFKYMSHTIEKITLSDGLMDLKRLNGIWSLSVNKKDVELFTNERAVFIGKVPGTDEVIW